MITRLATVADIPAIAEVHYESFYKTNNGILPDNFMQHASLTKQGFALRWQKNTEELNKSMLTIVAEEQNKIIGFTTIVNLLNQDGSKNDKPENKFFYVHPDYLRQGVGKKLAIKAAETLVELNYNSVVGFARNNDLQANYFYAALGASAERVTNIKLLENDPAEISVEVTEFFVEDIKSSLENFLKTYSETQPTQTIIYPSYFNQPKRNNFFSSINNNRFVVIDLNSSDEEQYLLSDDEDEYQNEQRKRPCCPVM